MKIEIAEVEGTTVRYFVLDDDGHEVRQVHRDLKELPKGRGHTVLSVIESLEGLRPAEPEPAPAAVEGG